MEEERQYKTSDKNLLRNIWMYSKKYLFQIILTFIFLIIISFLQIVLPVISKTAIDNYIQKNYTAFHITDASLKIFEKNLSYSYKTDSLLFVPSRIISKDEYYAMKRDSVMLEEKYYPVDIKFKEYLSSEEIEYEVSTAYLFVEQNALRKMDVTHLKEVRSKDISSVKKFALLYVILLIVSFLFNYMQVIILAIVSENIMYDMRDKMMKHLMSLSMDFFHKNPIGRLVTRATNDIAALRELFTDVFIYSAKDIITIIGVIIIMLKMSWKLTFVVLSTMPFVFLLLFLFQKFARGAYRDVRTTLAKVNAFLSESITGVSLIQAFHQEKESFDDFAVTGKNYYKANMRQLFVFSIFRPLIDVMSYITIAIMIYVGGRGIFNGEFTIGILFAFLSYIELFFRPIFDFSEKYNIYQSAMASSERIFLLFEEKSSIKEPENPVIPKNSFGKIEFKNVSFEYKKNEPVLKNVSFTIEPNSSAAFVGATGAGKTTIINLLMRYYDATEGEILIDGINIKDMKIEFLRSYFGLVMQDVMIFSGDIKYNILLNRNIDDKTMIEYAEYVNADKFIDKLPKTYDTMLNERGSNLSTGQRQLLAFARALVDQPKVLILDEATSNIDSETEYLIQDAIKKIMHDRTTIAIAHRLSTIQDAHMIYALQKGRIVEQGTHKELLANRKYYYDLYKLQYVK
ncbi:TPA: ABC transporter ATP-binding protein [candidate division WOR-3 bacterium]|uniref:ABC transporter ATP-binding protein n=1 Tax=candidate division WOR-3 bacterium TaxID=2052148 RepID=A0A350H8N0_UNCW3|nr:ABC transporter ATP-binding protein [candidate division WOR-3 bacterium]